MNWTTSNRSAESLASTVVSMSAKAAIWVRVSTDRQHADNQIPGLERPCLHRG